jgi:carboxymethylenebutenolidase
MSESLTVKTPDGNFQAYVARPAKVPAASVVVIQEIFGVNADLRETCDELAKQGYIAVSPDLFWRLEPGLDMSDRTEAEWKKGMELYTAFNIETGVADIAATMKAAQGLNGASGKIGVMGFCLGGLMTFITASRHRADAAVVYYGGQTERYLDEAKTLATPLLMHLGEEDEYISKDAQQKIKRALKDLPNVQIYTYPGCSHAFARHGGAHYDAAAASLANGRTADFLKLHLK